MAHLRPLPQAGRVTLLLPFVLVGPVMLLAAAMHGLAAHGPVGWGAALLLLVGVLDGTRRLSRATRSWWASTKAPVLPPRVRTRGGSTGAFVEAHHERVARLSRRVPSRTPTSRSRAAPQPTGPCAASPCIAAASSITGPTSTKGSSRVTRPACGSGRRCATSGVPARAPRGRIRR